MFHHASRWRVRDRLRDEDTTNRIASFKAGTPKRVLAERYGIVERSVKTPSRKHGVKRRPQYDIQP